MQVAHSLPLDILGRRREEHGVFRKIVVILGLWREVGIEGEL